MPEMQYVSSSNVDQIGYDDALSELHVVFKDGSLYIYDGVPQHLFESLVEATSTGSFLNREIKGTYSFRRA